MDEYFEKSGIYLDLHKIEYNPGLRALAKLMLNSFWGEYHAFIDMFSLHAQSKVIVSP